MRNILAKEMRLSASILAYCFIAFGLMFLLPGYPILCGVFFVTLGIFQSFQSVRENNDILFSALLPIAKRDVVKGKYIFVCFIELCSLLVMGAAVIVRMTLLAGASVYLNNAMMNANGFALGMAFFIFGLFNMIFLGGFFATAYKFEKPFVLYIIIAFLMIGFAEALHHIPGLECLNAFGTDHAALQFCLLLAGILIYLILTFASYRSSCRSFDRIDL